MTTAVLFPLAREGFLTGEIDWDTATIKVALMRGYTYNSAHKFMSDLTGAGATIVATTAALGSKTTTNGVAGAADTTFTAVPTGAACSSLVIYQSSAVGGGADVATTAQRVIAYIDNATGLPITPNGADINVTFDTGASKIFAL